MSPFHCDLCLGVYAFGTDLYLQHWGFTGNYLVLIYVCWNVINCNTVTYVNADRFPRPVGAFGVIAADSRAQGPKDGTDPALDKVESTKQESAGGPPMDSRTNWKLRGSGWCLLLALVLVAMTMGLGGCNNEDCVSCVSTLDPPVVPTGVYSVSGDNDVTVYWYDIAYSPYDGRYNENVVSYAVYSRFFQEGDQFDPNRDFYFIGEVAWDQNFDPTTGQHWFDDLDAENGFQYEYAVAAVNAAGFESALSYEFVADAPLPMSPLGTSVELFDSRAGANQDKGGFDFSRAGENPLDLNAGRVDPNQVGSLADIRIYFEGIVPYVERTNQNVKIQDFGVFTDPQGNLVFEGVSWAPSEGYSSTGKLELINGHIYVVELFDPTSQEFHFAKFGIVGIASTVSVQTVWAYQLIPGLPELKAPELPDPVQRQTRVVRF